MIFWETFINSLKLPQKKAVFQLNRTGMDITVLYMFLLLAIVSVPALLDRISGANGIGANMNILFLLIYFFIFYYLPLVIIFFSLLTIIAYIGTWLAHLMDRKLHLSNMWKMAAYTTTIPFLLYALLASIFPISDYYLGFFIIYTMLLIIKIITIYPKRKRRTKSG